MASSLQKIVSGGQTGVDRAALDAAIRLGIPHGGWCPLGRRAEDGPIPPHYKLRETESPEYAVRTQRNVIDSDATLILYRRRLSGGTALTRRLAREHGRAYLKVDLNTPPDYESVRQWLEERQVRVLNVAGPRERSCPGIYEQAARFLQTLLGKEG